MMHAQMRPQGRTYCRPLPACPSLFAILLAFLLSPLTTAVFIDFDNCLSDSVIFSHNPKTLQWTPLFLDATFSTNNARTLNITIYGNVSGQASAGRYPPPSDPSWQDDDSEFGKIVNISVSQKNAIYTTLYADYALLTYSAWTAPRMPFCDSVLRPGCPLGPAFNANPNDPSQLPAFSVAHDFFNSYAFTTLSPTFTVKSGEQGAAIIACVSARITPDLGESTQDLLTYLPVVVLVFVAVATLMAAIASPWGTTDFFKWTSNYGRDDDLLRLVTPGFGDCLQYIQFIVLSGGLNLSYPGFFQPVVSNVGWAALMFNQSFVSHEHGARSVVDGIYVTKGEYGLTKIRQLIGMSKDYDMWAGMVIWLLVIIIFVVLMCQLGFFIRWAFRTMAKTSAEDLRRKNWPFTGGNVVRIVCNFFLLPIVTLSMFQLVVASRSPAVVVAFAVLLIVGILVYGAWNLRLIFTTKPRSLLFDDLSTVLLYGPLYNTYSDEAAPFALVPALLTFVRGVAIGAIQPSGIGQLVVLAICEVILVLTLHAFRPFHSPTSMNAYHTVFATVRLCVVLLMVAFAPSLGVTEGPKGWIGYVILLLHALLLVFGFFLNAIQRIIEITARLAGVGRDKTSGAPTRRTKAFGIRQLSRRQRRPQDYRFSQHSDAAILEQDIDMKSAQYGGRSRSVSASSAILLNSNRASNPRVSSHLDRALSGDTNVSRAQGAPDPYSAIAGGVAVANGAASTSPPSRKPQLSLKTGEGVDPYYRPPRPRRPTGEMMTPGAKSRGSADWTSLAQEGSIEQQPERQQPERQQQGLPSAAYLRQYGDSDPNLIAPRQSDVDYAVREVDYYYGVRGPALSSQPTRKLKTGPADPVGPVSSATGWFRGIFGGKKKDSGKGFEVVRSSRAPPPGFDDDPTPKLPEEPYRDNPSAAQLDAYLPGERTRSNTGDTEPPDDDEEQDEVSSVNTDDEEDELEDEDIRRVSDVPPALGPIDPVGELDMPSRWNSRRSRKSGQSSRRSSKRKKVPADTPPVPAVPVQTQQQAAANGLERSRLSPVMDGSERSNSQTISSRVPFSGPEDPRRPSIGAESALSLFGESTAYDRNITTQDGSASNAAPSRVSTATSGEAQPTSYGRVVQHRASDRLRQSTIGPNVNTGSSAVVEQATPRASRDTRGTEGSY